MVGTATLQSWDWIIIALYLIGTMVLGLYFTRRAGRDMASFFVSSRSLPWYLAGVSLVATSFASDTPLWVSSLVRKHGVYYVWQYWAAGLGATLGFVLFARLWRRVGVLTDIELIELRYSGKAAAGLRFWSGFSTAVLFCPLIVGWVTKAMEVIAREAMGLPAEYRMWTTMTVVVVALVSCALSGLWGVVYTDFFQFILATIGTVALACFAVHEVGGLQAMVAALAAADGGRSNVLNIAPSIGPSAGQMSVWNAIGYFGVGWIGNALSDKYNAQRILACKDSRHASLAMMFFAFVYYAIIAWPWIVVALCSIILLPNLGEGVGQDSAYPRMVVMLLPAGMRGLLVVALLAAFMSTISTLFNWASSYLVNDVYKRFLVPDAAEHHYVNVGRLGTVFIAVAGGLISFAAKDIQQLLTIAYVIWAGPPVVGMLRWFWWRLNGAGELAATVATWILAPALLFGHVFDAPVQYLFHTQAVFSKDDNLLGARMLFMLVAVTVIAVVVSLLTAPTDPKRLEEFVVRARPFGPWWKPVTRRLGARYAPSEGFGEVLWMWAVATVSMLALLFGLGKLLLGEPLVGSLLLAVFAVTLMVILKRVNADSARDEAAAQPATKGEGKA